MGDSISIILSPYAHPISLEVVNKCDETIFFPAVDCVFAWFYLVTNGLYTTEDL